MEITGKSLGTGSGPRPRAGGFTLVELLITVAIGAVLAGLTIPSFQFLLVNMEVRSVSFELVSQMVFARSEALKRNASVQVKAVAGEWNKGSQVEFAAAVLRSQAAVKRVGVTANPVATTSIVFTQTGRVANAPVTLEVADPTGSSPEKSCITLGLTGIASSKKGAC